MENIGLVMDFEANTFNRQPFVRELGYCLKSGESGSIHFMPPVDYNHLTPADRRTERFCRERVHGLPFRPPINGLPQSYLAGVVRTLYARSQWDYNNSPIVAYKGGSLERSVLRSLGLPCTNLEDFGCPKFSELLRQQTFPVVTCGSHVFGYGGTAL